MLAERERPMEQARALAREATEAWRGTDPDHAIEACDHALAILLPVGSSDALVDVLLSKGSILRDRGSHSAAADLYSQSLAVADSIGYRDGRARAVNCLGTIAQLRGDLIAAERWYGEAARLAHRNGDRRLSGMVQQNLGVVAEVQGRTDEALAHFRLALASFETEKAHDAVIWVLNNLGLLYTRDGAYGRAAEAFDRALALAQGRGDVASEAIVEENRAALFVATGRLELAEAAALRALDIADKRHDNTRRAASLRHLARIARVRNSSSPYGVSLLERSLALCELGEDVELRAEILCDLGDACGACGDRARAKEFWRRALDVARIAGITVMIRTLQARLRPGTSGRSSGASEATAS